MRIPSVQFLNGGYAEVGKILTLGKTPNFFGSGTHNAVITKSGVMTKLLEPFLFKGVLELQDLTIVEGATVVGNDYQSSQNIAGIPFFLKVNGTLTINGNLNMNGQGGTVASARSDSYSAPGVFVYETPYLMPSRDTTFQVPTDLWKQLFDYGKYKSFFDMKTRLVGSGSSFHFRSGSGNSDYHKHSRSPLNSGGASGYLSADNKSAGAGGFLALYYETLDNSGPVYTDELGTFYTNINCNGGSGQLHSTDPRSSAQGGGMMVIAARNIVIGPNGSITCNPMNNTEFLTYPLLHFSNRNSGGIGFMNRPPVNVKDWNYGNPVTRSPQSGGCGFCIGYKVETKF